MKKRLIYEAVSRVVSDDKEVVGFMCQLKPKKKSIYMSIEVISFGLTNNTFEIENVKLGSNGKPRGSNGFLLSKLPMISLMNLDEVHSKLLTVLKCVIKDMVEKDTKISFNKDSTGIIATYSVSFYSKEYSGIELGVAHQELNLILRYYLKHLPNEYKGFCDKIEGTVKETGVLNIVVSKNIVNEEVVSCV